MTNVGVLHPGAMGSVVASLLDRPAWWASAGRSKESFERATAAGLRDAGTVAQLAAEVDVVLSICPPESADDVATEVAATGFGGIYVDANAVSPATATQIADRFSDPAAGDRAGPRFVDGGIVGPPPTGPGLTRLYLSGPAGAVGEVTELFAGTDLEVRSAGEGIGGASAVKMCFAAWTKGTSALLLAIRALATVEGVDDVLIAEWETSMPDLPGRSDRTTAAVGPKAWRFAGEMREIASTFAAAELPDGFHGAAAELYERLAPLKGHTDPALAEALALLVSERQPPGGPSKENSSVPYQPRSVR